MLRVWVFGMLVLIVFCSACTTTPSPELTCSKRCLSDLTEQYIEAMVRGSTDALPLAKNLRVTSNGKAVVIGRGETWQAGITMVNRHTFFDPITQTSIFFGTIAGNPNQQERTWWHYAVRLSASQGKIVEIEEQSSRTGFQWADKVEVPFKEAAIFDALLPEDERVSSNDLIRAADSYWNGLTSGEGGEVLMGPNCQRTEFGKYSTNATKTHDRNGRRDFVSKPRVGKSCLGFFDNERFRWPVVNRRYYIVDEDRGVVVGIGQLKKFGEDGNDGLTLIEAFKVINGGIEFLWAPAFTFKVENSGWPDWQRPGR